MCRTGFDGSNPEHRVKRSLVGFVVDEFILIQYSPLLKDADAAE
jgi:hypothetical protein